MGSKNPFEFFPTFKEETSISKTFPNMYRAWSQQLLNEVRLSKAKAHFLYSGKNDTTAII